ncbi:MAG: DUF4423 domain-containing protein [Bdellovibrionota bacterium]|nr:DUF4423 domain-containing protein [Bdellovibrionota bacterium]
MLELTRVNDFKGDLQWIAKCLDLPIHIVQIAVERLLRLDFLKIHEDGRWEDTLGEASNTGNQFTEIALRKLQKQILEKAMKALDEVKYTERVQSAMTMAFSKKLLPQSKLKIIQFINELNSDAQEAGDFDEVYQLSVSLYPISDSERNKK